MNSRERLQKTLAHRDPGSLVLDLGATAVTGIHVKIIAELREHYGLESRPVKVIEPYQMLGEVDGELIEAMGVDVVGIAPKNDMFGIPREQYKPFRTFWGQEVLLPEQFHTTSDENGDLLIHPEGDTSIPPSGRMPRKGYFFDAIIRQDPIDETLLDPEDNLEEFKLLTEEDLAYWEKEVAQASATGKGVIANFGGTAFGDIALVPGMGLKHPRGIRDISEWYMSTVMRSEYLHQVFDCQATIALKNLAMLLPVAKDKIDAVFICGTDFGTQDSTFCSPETFRELYAPYYRRINDWIHTNTAWKTFKHSCGAVESFMQDFIDAGFDIINPVQVNARGMDPMKLKEKYGASLVFWGGGADTQKLLPFGTPDQVRDHVLGLCEIFAPEGGFVFNTVHNIQANVPVENVVAMLGALDTFRTS